MKFMPIVCCLSLLCLMAGCADESTASGDPSSGNSKAAGAAENSSTKTTEDGNEPASDAETMGRKVDLSPQNASIEFVGVHTDKSKEDRVGTFEEFSGTAMVDQTLMSVQVDIKTASVKTEFDKLTDHLKNADFFDVNRYPTARFESTQILDQQDGTVKITGNLTLLDNTHSITFPAKVSTDGELKLEAKFDIDRTEWGMDKRTDSVEKIVGLTIKIGK